MATDFRSDVYTSEVDLTFTTQIRASSWAVALGASKEGPLDPQFVTDSADGIAMYGEPDAGVSLLHHSMLAFLKEGGGIWIKRVTDGDAETGGALVTNRTRSFELHTDNAAPAYSWADETHIWVLDTGDSKVYVYLLANGTIVPSKEITLETANADPHGIWGNDTYVWVLDPTDSILYAYSKEDGSYVSTANITLDGTDNADPDDWLTGDDTHIWVPDSTNATQMYAYNMATQAYVTGATLTITKNSANVNPVGGYISGGVLYILDSADTKFYGYATSGGAHNSTEDWAPHADNANVSGVAFNGTYVYIMDSTDTRAYAYANKALVTERQLDSLGTRQLSPENVDLDMAENGAEAADNLFYIHAIGPGAYSSNIQCEIASNNLRVPVVTGRAIGDNRSALPAETYDYLVTAISSTGETLPSAKVGVTTVANQSVELTWTAVRGAQGYRVYRKLIWSNTYSLVANAPIAEGTVTYRDNGRTTLDTDTRPPAVAPSTEPQFLLNVYDTRVSRTAPQEVHECSLKNRLNGLGEQTEIAQRVNARSSMIRIRSNIDAPGLASTVVPVMYNVPRFSLSAGTDGGTVTASDLMQAVEEFRDKESYPAALFLDAGYTIPAWHKRLDTICKARGDSIAFTSVPATEQKAQDAIAFRAITQNINSNRSALFCNDHYRLDEYSGENLYVPASAVAAARLAYTDRVANQAYSIAGFRRGIAGETLKLREKYANAERDQLAANNINYFTTERGAGFVLREAYTLQSAYSALSHISVRRVLDIVEQSTERSLKIYLQEPNDDILVLQLTANLRKFYRILQRRRMIRAAEVFSKTPPEEVELGNLQVYSLITPLLPAVRIRHTVALTGQDVSFDAALEQLIA